MIQYYPLHYINDKTNRSQQSTPVTQKKDSPFPSLSSVANSFCLPISTTVFPSITDGCTHMSTVVLSYDPHWARSMSGVKEKLLL